MNQILCGDALTVLKTLESESVACIVSSPPYYGLRSYNAGSSEIGQEPTLQEFLSNLVEVFRECRRVLKKDGVCWVNMGDSYSSSATGGDPNNSSKLEGGKTTQREAGKRPSKLEKAFKPKDRMMVPARLAIALQEDGWWLRDEIIWSKPNPMPSSVQDRTTPAHEMIYLLTKSARYFYNAGAIRTEPNQDSLARYDRKSSYDGEKPYAMANPPTGRKTDKQRGHSRQHTGFNDRWDAMEKAEQQVNGANCRSVWTFSTQGFNAWGETCRLEPVRADDASGDNLRITSPDCPTHAGQPDLVPRAFCGERVADALSRILGIDADLVRGLLLSPAPTGLHRAVETEGGSLDSLLPLCSEPAKPSSKRSRKTAHAPETTEPCTAFEQTPSGTDGTLGESLRSGSVDRTTENNTLAGSARDASESGLSEQIQSHNEGKCTCSYWVQFTEKTSHFATYPEELPKRCILAGSREGDVVLDPFGGSGTTGAVAKQLGRKFVLIELNPEYVGLIEKRLASVTPSLFAEAPL